MLRAEPQLDWELPVPMAEERPMQYASRLGDYYGMRVDPRRRRALGQFFTPVEIARLMARFAGCAEGTRGRLLDPGAGTGVLACAMCEALPHGSGEVHLDAYELDSRLAELCRNALDHAKVWLAGRKTGLSFTVHEKDFVTANATALAPRLFDPPAGSDYDIALLNPPYFKLRKADKRAMAAATVVHGQPNIYAIFMAITASMLAENGVMVSITPRSFTSGEYFRRFRKTLFSKVVPEAVHVFDSRREAFRSDGVLQENVILKLRKGTDPEASSVAVSSSRGVTDLDDRKERRVQLASVVDLKSRQVVFSIPEDEVDDRVIGVVRAWPHTLPQLGLEVSTGPVVAFRAEAFLRDAMETNGATVPLLWLQNVRPMTVRWPVPDSRKAQYIVDSQESSALLIRNATYVVVRRFTAKEERRRLTAAPLLRGQLAGRVIGLENHLNYIHRPHGEVGEDEALGVAGFLGSALVDRYFRVSSGSTQVNAADLRVLPIPATDALETLGREIRKGELCGSAVDAVMGEILSIPSGAVTALGAREDGKD